MVSRSPIVVTAAAALAVLATAGPASAAVAYDPQAKTGFVSRADLRTAFGWTDATLAAKAGGLVFNHEFWTDDTYAVRCGGPAFAVVHHRDFGRFQLGDALAHARGRGASGYGGRLTGIRLTGARFGISGTSVAPAAGQPCPEAGRGAQVTASDLVSTKVGWSLTATSGDDRRELLTTVAES